VLRPNSLARPDRCGNHPAMCGRFASFLPAEAIARIFGMAKPLPNLSAVLERRAYERWRGCPQQPQWRH
jgi:hypothetical protein